MRSFESSDAIKRLPDQFFASLVKRVKEMQEKGYDLINLGQGNPDLPTPERIIRVMQEASTRKQHHQYSPFQGYRFLKEAVATYYQNEYNVSLDPETEVAILPGSKTGLVELSQCLLNPGDTALVPDPGYPDYLSGIALANVQAEMMPLKEEHDFLPQYDQIEPSILEKAKLMFLNYPNNPTAAVADQAFFNETVELAKKHHIAVCHDFAYATIGFDQQKPISFMQTEGAKDVGVEMFTLSKAYNMAGWRVGFAVGNPSIIAQLEAIQDHLYVSLFGAIQEAAAEALSGPQEDTKALTKTYQNRRDIFINTLRQAGWDVQAPKGTFFCWLKVPDGFTSQSFSDYLLNHAHVVTAPGNGFGDYGEGYVRCSLVTSEERLKKAATRIQQLGLF
ncbi:aminotransferase [Pelagirhabdus alkalitolerans]|uniref:Aminotransferase n=1 Tax=Pelagirhabdus alkalitolerans TaxID=1612202 RepID=A0A1G6GMF4_9BACI|nr:pyridoxal phosphate-dependent aminotransferase [Pelagirhabdus alkalitolerans]SDB83119.1 aminotransferase [Pelagirhabdus alkalitolerans]